MRKPITTHFCVCADGGLLRAESPTLPPRAAVGTTLERRKIQNRTDIMNHLRCKLSAPLSKAILGLPFTAHQHAAPWGEPRPAVQKRTLKLKPGSPCCFFSLFVQAMVSLVDCGRRWSSRRTSHRSSSSAVTNFACGPRRPACRRGSGSPSESFTFSTRLRAATCSFS